jgi:signal transduction histidine kinase
MAHDLKTPLTVVRGLTETLAADPDLDAAERARLSTVVHRKTLETLALMSRFFELARLEAGDAALPLAPVDVAELARSSILFFYETIAAQGLEVALDMPDTPVYAVANADALSRALHNLIANALRYGADGGSIGLAVRSSATHVSVEVTDRGRGIPERHQAQIFDRRYTADAARSAASGGSGLGLAITRRLVELMGGRIMLRSTPGSATVFTIELARAAPADRIA